jgi:uncharacterized protein (DUF1697 family)
MLELAAIFGEIGCTDVSTYIQSGNVVFRAPASLAASLPTTAARRIAEEFGCKVPVILRTASELRAARAENPFVARGLDPNALHVMFLADRPTARAVASIDAARFAPEELALRGRDIFLYCPNGMGKSKMTNAYFDARLTTTSTARNWRTLEKLVAMTSS